MWQWWNDELSVMRLLQSSMPDNNNLSDRQNNRWQLKLICRWFFFWLFSPHSLIICLSILGNFLTEDNPFLGLLRTILRMSWLIVTSTLDYFVGFNQLWEMNGHYGLYLSSFHSVDGQNTTCNHDTVDRWVQQLPTNFSPVELANVFYWI